MSEAEIEAERWAEQSAKKIPKPDGFCSSKESRPKSNQKWTSRKMDYINAANCCLPGAAFKVAICILNHANQRSEQAWPSQETIALETALSERTVMRAIKQLVHTGWIERRTTRGTDGLAHNVYTIRWKNIQAAFDKLAEAPIARKAARRYIGV
jgi:hypothetical protein